MCAPAVSGAPSTHTDTNSPCGDPDQHPPPEKRPTQPRSYTNNVITDAVGAVRLLSSAVHHTRTH